ncbi:MFS transporter [Microbacterium terregens]|uniref:MFS transporter n=1 Tax=Microbacterium terregens TaxID=69363 RepID=A0ABV5T1Y3_9MICO
MTQSAAPPQGDQTQLRKVLISSFFGSTIEFYDFILYATATATVFVPVFFSTLDPLLGMVASYLTFAAGYVSRPLGGLIFGHFGDKIGRKKMLMVSMTVMGVASVLIGLVPAVPVWGAFLLLTLRLVQGIAIGGEWGGAALMSLEHAKGSRRGFAASFANAGGPAGAFLGTAALALFAMLPEDQFLAWGWRVPFLFSVVLLVVGLYIRAQVAESPIFIAALKAAEEKKALTRSTPIAKVLQRPRVLVVVGLVGMGAFVIQALFSTFGVTFAVGSGISREVVLWAFAFSQLFAAFAIPAFAALSDRVGRRPVMLGGYVGMALLAFPLFWALASGTTWMVFGVFLVALSLLQSMTFGPMAAFLAENFATTSRYTGASLGYQLAALLGAGFTPVIVASIFAASGGEITGVIWFLIGGCVISAVVLAVFTKESRHVEIDETVTTARSSEH